MSEIKNSFTSGKMNKDLDERLVPSGEYRDAMNIQVSTSEGSDVGAIENILGNEIITSDPLVDIGSTCVGSIADEANDCLYYLVAGPNSGKPTRYEWENQDAIINAPNNYIFRDKIFKIANDSVTPVFVDNHTVKTTFDTSYPFTTGVSQTYSVNATNGIYAGMVCYFFNGPSHALISQSGGFGENDFSGPSNLQYGLNQNTNPVFYGDRSVKRIVLEAEYDSVTNKTLVKFDKNLQEEHQVNQNGLGEAAYVDSSNADYNYLVFTKQKILNFECNNTITGISILDDFLLFTDNDSEPKKINVTRSIAGTHGAGEKATMLVVPDRDISIDSGIVAKEEHVTVIKKYPTKKLVIEQEIENPTSAESDYNFTKNDGTGNFVLAEVGEEIIENFSSFTNGTEWGVGDELRFLRQGSTGNLPDDFDVRCKVKQDLSSLPLGPGILDPVTGLPITFPPSTYKLEILSISPTTPVDLSIGPNQTNFTYVNIFDVVKVLDTDSLFEKKFVRFGYRWKYQDGEYSTFSPFTDTVFAPSFFEYNAVLGYNKAMENHLTSIKLREIIASNIPDDVVQVDLLYIESNATTVYIVDTIKYNDLPDINIGTSIYNSWDVNSFNIKSDLIYSAVPANQLLRPYDNVPRKALALEVTGNRIVFANYLQNYNLDNKPTLMASFDKRWKTGIIGSNQGKPVLYDPVFFDSFHVSNPDLSFYRLQENLIEPLMASPSIKSIRSYQLGFTYIDDYGRETPVFTSDDATVVLNKSEAKEVNLLTSRITSPSPDWAKSFKMYIKETSNEYYNLPLDRVYKAEDGNLWLSFPSSERNKVDEQTYLILKKGADSDSLVEPKAKYKIIAIENEAPDFLKTKDRLLAEVVGGGGITPPIQHLFNDTTANAFTSALTPGTKSFNLSASNFSEESSVALQDFGNVLSFDFRDASGRYSKRYPIVDISIDDSLEEYTIVTETPILSSEDWMFDDNNALPYSSTLKLRFYKSVTRVKPEFDGKFFVKINGDSTAATFLNTSAGSAPEYAVVAAMNAYYFSDTGKFGVTKGTIGRSGGGNIDEEWNYYTSSGGINPHDGTTGAVIHPGLGQSGYVNQSGIESTDGKRDWELALDFGTSSDGLSNWFIDEIYYAGTHPPSSNNTTNAVDGPNVTNSFNYGKGVHEDSGQEYIEISFSQIGPDACNGGQAILNQGTAPEINFAKFNDNDIWEVGSAINPDHVDQFPIINQLVPGTKFRIANDDNNTIYEITGNVTKERRYNYAQWALVQTAFDNWVSTWTSSNTDGDLSRKAKYEDFWEIFGMPINRRVAYRIPVDKHINGTNGTIIDVSGTNKTVTAASADDAAALGNTPVVIQFIEQRTDDDNEVLLSSNPAIFETEPKEAVDLNIFYEISDAYPTRLDINNIERYIPKGSVVTCNTHPLLLDFNEQTFVTGFEQNMFGQLMIKFNVPLRSTPAGATELIFTRADGGYTTIQGSWYTPRTNALNPAYISLPPATPNETGYEIYPAVGEIGLSWFNCYSFGNGVESNRLRDDFNQVFINKGVKASTTLDTIYKEERRGSGLIYSGLYNSKSGVNSLNQFIQAEKITKDLNTTYGTIQKLFSRNTDLIAFCEDRVLRILANKDAVFNADGNPNLIATPNVLGQTVPFSGDYGISTNPESFAFESYRAYFTDAKRGAVLRLSMDGLTNLSDYGMSRYFKDNLKNYDKILGSYDDKKDNYNLTLDQECFSSSGKMSPPVTISYKESVRGWVSFKSFIPESAVSMKGDYYTFKAGLPFKHHVNQKRNTFYGVFEPTSIEFLLNQAPDVVKSFKTLNYEGSQAKVYEETAGSINSNPGQGYYNLNDKQGWSVQYITTDQETGKVQGDQFIEKEGKWFNYIQGNHSALNTNNIDTNSFHFQGIGRSSSLPTLVYGCVDPNANNYYSGANVDDGTCEYAGCTDPLSYNGATTFIHPTNGITYTATIDDGSCDYQGCMTQYAPNIYHPNTVASTNYDPSYTVPGPCVYPNTYDCDTVNGGYTVNTTGTGLYLNPPTNIQCPPCGQGVATGCTDPTAMNYDSTPGLCHDASLCEYYDFGCYDDGSLDTTATNNAGFPLFVPLQTQLDSATNNGCNVGILPYYHDSYSYTDPFVNSPTFGTTISVIADNVTSPMPTNAGMDCGCEYTGCMDNTNSNYMPWATINDATMCCVDGCTDPSASNYDAAATCDDGSCTYAQCLYEPTIGGIPTVSGTGAGATEYGLFNYTGPWFGVPIIQTSIPDVVFEEVLENIVTYFNATTLAYIQEFNLSGSGNNTEEVCTYGFTQCIDLLLTSKIVTSPVSSLNPNGSAEWQSSENYGNGLVSDLSGLQDFHLPQLQPLGSSNAYNPLPNNVAAQSFRNLAVHMQNISSFIHSETDPSSDYYGLNMLDVFSSQYNGTTFGSGLSQISFKSLPLSSMIKLDLSNHKQLYSVEIADCGLKEITLPHDGLLGRIFITNNYIPGNYAHAAGGYPYAGGGGSPGYITGHGYVNYPDMNPNLPDEITGNNSGSNYSYNDPAYDKIGNPANPIKIHAIGGTPSSTYYPVSNINPAKRFDWNNGTPQQGGNVDQRSIIRLINLPELMHVYLDLDLLLQTKNGIDVIGKMENAYDGTGNDMKFKAAFTTLGCHPDMKIHVGSQAMVDACERSFGTSDQSSPNWTQEGETFFLQYFEDGHRFII